MQMDRGRLDPPEYDRLVPPDLAVIDILRSALWKVREERYMPETHHVNRQELRKISVKLRRRVDRCLVESKTLDVSDSIVSIGASKIGRLLSSLMISILRANIGWHVCVRRTSSIIHIVSEECVADDPSRLVPTSSPITTCLVSPLLIPELPFACVG